MPVDAPFSAELSSESFQDKAIRSKVQRMESKAFPIGDQEPISKRRKVSQESGSMLFVVQRFCKVLDILPTRLNALDNVEDILM